MSSFTNDIDILSNVEMNEKRFLTLLEKLIGESVNLQNNPAQGTIYELILVLILYINK
jgi:hypothetical protein